MLKLLIVSMLMAGSAMAQTNADLKKEIDVLADEIQSLKSESTISNNISLGGYGEITYSKAEEGEENSTGKEPVADAKRAIIYMGYKFDSKWSFTSEIEVEHANEIYLEQAYIQYELSESINLKIGTVLIPMGLLNLYHEGPSFLGVNRTETEGRIIPSTWRENGVGIDGKYNKFNYSLYVVNGLTANTGTKQVNASGVRNGRQKGSKANAHKAGVVLAGTYHFTAGQELGYSAYSGKLNDTAGVDVDHEVVELHYKGDFGALKLRALWAQLTLSNTEDLNAVIGSDVGSKMIGQYIELGYDVIYGQTQKALIPFVRYESINTHAEVETGTVEDKSVDEVHTTFGIVYKPLENLALKADYSQITNEAKSGNNKWNLGIAWNF